MTPASRYFAGRSALAASAGSCAGHGDTKTGNRASAKAARRVICVKMLMVSPQLLPEESGASGGPAATRIKMT